MNLENQVCTEQQGDRLKELGVIQESLFYHTHSDWGVMPKKSIDFSGDPTSAFIVAELGVMLGPVEPPRRSTHKLFVYWHDVIDHRFRKFDTEAQARAELLIWLLANSATTAAEVNQRLQNT